MDQHPTIEQLSRWRRGDVADEEVLAIAAHLATCRVCTTRAAEQLGLAEAAHAMCDDIEMEETPRRFEARRLWPLLIAASVIIAFTLPMLWKRRPEPVTPSRGPIVVNTRDEWSVLVDHVRLGAAIDEPEVLRSIRSEADVLRGPAGAHHSFDPSGVIVKTTRPRFTWPAAKGSTSEIQIFHDDSEVMHSGVLDISSWQPQRELARGATYTWTVRVEHDGRSEILPASPAPLARFHIIDAATLADLESAERAHPGDHLLLGILDARAGLAAEAQSQLRLVTDRRDAAVAQRLMRNIDSWLK